MDDSEAVLTEELAAGTRLEVKTASRTYVVEIREKGQVFVSGNPKYCPKPTAVNLAIIRPHRSMVFEPLPAHHSGHAIHTSPVLEIRKTA